MTLPQVFCPGFPRCGTTYIARVLNQHPEIYTPFKDHHVYSWPVKNELNYFMKMPERAIFDRKATIAGFNQHMENYAKHFKEGKINIDFSICTAYDGTAAQRVRKCLGPIKIIFFTRIDRQRHQESVKTMVGPRTRPEYSQFEDYMKAWEIFPEVLHAPLEEILKNPERWFRIILDFIGVKDRNFKFNFDVPKHSSQEIKHARQRI